MPDKAKFPYLPVTPGLFDSACGGNEEAFAEITGMLEQVRLSHAEWPADTHRLFKEGLGKMAEKMDSKQLTKQACRILGQALEAGMDGAILRDRYVTLAKLEFSGYSDPVGLAEALCIRDSSVPLAQVALRWKMLKQIQSGAICYDSRFTRGIIFALDSAANEVQIQQDKRRNIPLDSFLKDYYLVRDLSILHSLISSGKRPVRRPGHDLAAELEDCVMHIGRLPQNFLHSILVERNVVDEDYFTSQLMGSSAASAPVKKAVAEPVAAPKPVAPVSKSKTISVRWDESRTVLELYERLKEASSLEVADEVKKENIERILSFAAPKEEQAENFANSLAYMQKMAGSLEDWIGELVQKLAATAYIWKRENMNRCAEISDKMQGKLAPFWFEIISKAVGAEWLAELTMKLPYRLWGHVERMLARTDKNLLGNTVRRMLDTKHATADMYYWLWRSSLSADVKDKYFSDVAMLFKVLHVEQKGNYLKAQRDLRHLVVDDANFQEQLMLRGDEKAIAELVRCVKRLPLLDSGEQQSILVKIVRLYPEAIKFVAEKSKVTMAIDKHTSIRAYKRRQAELDDLVNVQIPGNIKDIEVARAHGDLSENSEFKYAKERQRQLRTRRAEYEESLNGLRATNYKEVKVEKVVIPGCTVTLALAEGGKKTFHILGYLDSEPEKNIISYASPLGQVLMGHEAGMSVTLPSGERAKIAEVAPLSAEMLAYVAGE